MDIGKINNILKQEIEEMPWTYKYWDREGTLEFRNTGRHLAEDEIDELFENLLDKLKKDRFEILLEGKVGVKLEKDTYWLCSVNRDGSCGEKDRKLDRTELKDIFVESLYRIDSGQLPSNIIAVKADEIVDIYSESMAVDKFLHITIIKGPSITLRGDGGVQLRS